MITTVVLVCILPQLAYLVHERPADIGRDVPMLIDVDNPPHSPHQMLQWKHSTQQPPGSAGSSQCIQYTRAGAQWKATLGSGAALPSDLAANALVVIGNQQPAPPTARCALAHLRVTNGGIAARVPRLCKSRRAYEQILDHQANAPQGVLGGLAQAVDALGSVPQDLKSSPYAVDEIRTEQLCDSNATSVACFMGSDAATYDDWVDSACSTYLGTSVFNTEDADGLTKTDTALSFTRASKDHHVLAGSTMGDWLNAQGVSTALSESTTIRGYIIACLVLSVVYGVLTLAVLRNMDLQRLQNVPNEKMMNRVMPWRMFSWIALVVLTGLFWQFVYLPVNDISYGSVVSPHFSSGNINADFTAYIVKYLAILLVVTTSVEGLWRILNDWPRK